METRLIARARACVYVCVCVCVCVRVCVCVGGGGWSWYFFLFLPCVCVCVCGGGGGGGGRGISFFLFPPFFSLLNVTAFLIRDFFFLSFSVFLFLITCKSHFERRFYVHVSAAQGLTVLHQCYGNRRNFLSSFFLHSVTPQSCLSNIYFDFLAFSYSLYFLRFMAHVWPQVPRKIHV